MKTKEEILLKNGLMAFDFRDNSNKVLKAMDDYAKLAIEEDRKNLLKYAEATYPYSSVDEESILNAPMIELL